MLLVYDHENVLHITNEKGLRWNYEKTQKPQFLFDYDYLFYIPDENVFEFENEEGKHPLNADAQEEIREYIKLCDPPTNINLNNQIIDDLSHEVEERIKNVLSSIEDIFGNPAALVIASREMSNDPRRQIGRRVLDWMDFINGVYYRLKEEINQTLEIDLKDYESYANQLPSIPSQDTFYETSWADDRFDKSSDTLDINGGEEDIGEDKRSI